MILNNNYKRLYIIILFLFVSGAVLAQKKNNEVVSRQKKIDILSIDSAFIDKYNRIDTFLRDEYWKDNLNSKIETKAKVVIVEAKSQFRRKYRIVLKSDDSSKIALTYYVYTDNEEYKDILQSGDIFGFKGQFVMFTPLNSKRNAYIIDVILEDGAKVIE